VIQATPQAISNGRVLSEWHAVNGCLCTGVGFQRREVGAWSAVALVISYELLMTIISGMITRRAQALGSSSGYCCRVTCQIGGDHCLSPFRDLGPT
jgi:hypothetical protein